MSARPKVSDFEVVADSPRDDVDKVVGHVAVARVPGHLGLILWIWFFYDALILYFRKYCTKAVVRFWSGKSGALQLKEPTPQHITAQDNWLPRRSLLWPNRLDSATINDKSFRRNSESFRWVVLPISSISGNDNASNSQPGRQQDRNWEKENGKDYCSCLIWAGKKNAGISKIIVVVKRKVGRNFGEQPQNVAQLFTRIQTIVWGAINLT